MGAFPKRGRTKRGQSWRARLARREKIQRATDEAFERWEELLGLPGDDVVYDPAAPILRSLPRPQGLGASKPNGDRSALPPPRQQVVFKAGITRSLGRVFVWIAGSIFFSFGVGLDWLHGQNSEENRARRLRETFEWLGTTFIKIGQQLSMRLDLLPYSYTRELEKMLDDVEAFPVAEAIRSVEKAIGRPLDEVFAVFDPTPIGSASVACVYQAILNSGERVAVKVRRPGIGRRLAADMRALRWLMIVIEMLMFAPGFTRNFVAELQSMLMEELDFIREARFTDLYRTRMRKVRQFHFVTAPKVFFEFSNGEVMVTEFVTGILVKEILAVLDTEDEEALRKLEEMKFDRILVARRIQMIARFNNFENIIFHADLHPANILIRPGNRIVLIDFGSCGSFNRRELNSWRRWFDAQSVNDVGGMAQAALGILEPLPPIDRDMLGMRLEAKFWDDLYAIKSKHSVWSERISARLWVGFLELSREFQIPLKLNTLRMIRASMLSDTIANRLDNDQDPYQEFRYYQRGAGRRAKRRLARRVHNLLGPSKFIRLREGLETAINLLYQAQKTIDSLAGLRIGVVIGKIEYFLTLSLRLFIWIGLATPSVLFFNRSRYNKLSTMTETFFALLRDPVWIAITLVPILIILWRISFRLREPEPWNRQ